MESKRGQPVTSRRMADFSQTGDREGHSARHGEGRRKVINHHLGILSSDCIVKLSNFLGEIQKLPPSPFEIELEIRNTH